METSPLDLVRHFNASPSPDVDRIRRDEATEVDEAELEQLADRISAARSVY
jgi:hypothetical protein